MAQDLIARLRQHPDDLEAFDALRHHYSQIQDWASLANLLEGWAKRATQPHAAAAAFVEAAELTLHYLGDTARAMALLERALERDPANAQASTLITDVIERSGDTNRLLDHLQRRSAILARSGDKMALAAVEFRLGQLYEVTFQRPDRAIAHYRKAFEADPTLVPAIYAAREIYRAAGNPKAAATLFALEIKAEPDLERRVVLLRELAHMRAGELNDLHGGIDALGRALEQKPGDLAVMHELATMLLQRADQRGTGPAADQERSRAADLMYQLAQGVPPEHAMAYCETALDAVPAHDGALELLEHLAREQVREDLLPIRWVGYLQAAPDAPGAPARRKQLGFAYLEAGQEDDALVCLEPMLDLGDAEVAEALIELLRARGRDDDATRALGIAVAGLPPERRLPRLRDIVDALVKTGDVDSAMQRAHEILAIEPGDPEALGFLETEYRKRNDDHSLRDLMMEASRVPGVSPEVRRRRLTDVAVLSEEKLEDIPGAIGAWRAVVAVDPTDTDAQKSLARLLEQTEQWDELVQVLDRQAITETDPDAKVAFLLKLASVHRDQREDFDAALGALRAVRQLRPNDQEARNALCDALLLTEDVREAVPLLQERIEDTTDQQERIRLLEMLASTFEARLGDDERAFTASTQLLDDDPANLSALDRMERIDTRSDNTVRLLETLAYRAEVVGVEQRPDILVRIGRIADERLDDLGRAAEYYQQALDLAPDRVDVLDALCSVYDRGERFKDLVVLLRERAKLEENPTAQAELYRRIARTLAERVGNPDAAAEAWTKVLDAGEDEEALRALSDRARLSTDPELESLLDRLIDVVADDTERRDLGLERAELLHAADRTEEAVAALRSVVLQLDPQHLGAMQKLATYCESMNDNAGFADALELQLALLEDPGLRLPVAMKLADLYEGDLEDTDRALLALYAWIEAEPNELEPRERSAARLETTERYTELVQILDGIAQLTSEPERAGTATRRAAEIAASKLDDAAGAWSRLEPRILVDPEADRMLREIAETHGQHEQLAELFCRLAKSTEDPDTIRIRWSDAATLFEGPLGDPVRALEAMLRAYATDLADETMLAQVERLAGAAGAYQRLAQVYERLLRSVETVAAKVKLLLRHAKLLDEVAGEPSEALDRVFRACALVPDDDSVLEVAEELAPRAGRGDELLHVYDIRKSKADTDTSRVDALLRGARLCDHGLRDRERSFQYIAQAVALTVRSPELAPSVEEAVDAMDQDRPELGNRDATRSLIGLYRAIASDSEDNPRAGADLLLRAARLLEEVLTDPEEAFAAVRGASELAAVPHVLDALEAISSRQNRAAELDRHLEHLIEEALDSTTAAELLRRRGRLLEEVLQKYNEAADVFRQLISVSKDDHEAADHLIECLRKSGKHQDLLIALDREIRRAKDDARRLQLMRAVAIVWERDLKNKWEAIDAQKKILKQFPDDPEATAAITRLNTKADGDDGEDPLLDEPLLDEPLLGPSSAAHDLPTEDLPLSALDSIEDQMLDSVEDDALESVEDDAVQSERNGLDSDAPIQSEADQDPAGDAPFHDDELDETRGPDRSESPVDVLLAGGGSFDDETAYEGGSEGSVDEALASAPSAGFIDGHTLAEGAPSLDEEFPPVVEMPEGGIAFEPTLLAGADVVADISELGSFTDPGDTNEGGVVQLLGDDELAEPPAEESPFESVPPPASDFRDEGTLDLDPDVVEERLLSDDAPDDAEAEEYEDVLSLDGMDVELLEAESDSQDLADAEMLGEDSIEELDAELLDFEELEPEEIEPPRARSLPPPPPED